MKNLTGSDIRPVDLLPEALDYQGPDRVVSSIEFAEEVASQAPKPSLKCGIGPVDAAVDGFQPGELIVVSGPTSMGKTTFCETAMLHMRKTGHFSLFFTFENTAASIAKKHATPDTVIFLPRQHVAMDLEWLRLRCLEAKMKFNCEAVFIDHLHYLVPLDAKVNMSLLVGHTMRFLKKEIALAMNLAVFIVCHVGKLDMEEEPSIANLRDSSFVGQEADTVLMVWRRWDLDNDGRKLETRLQGLATIKVEKARRTGVMGHAIKIRKDGNRLTESTNEPEKQSYSRRKSDADRREDWWNK